MNKPVRVASKVVEGPTVLLSHTFPYLYGSKNCLDQWHFMQLMEARAAHLRKVRKVQSTLAEKLKVRENLGGFSLTHCGRVTQICVLRYNCAGRVTQICVFNTVKLGTSASSP